MFGRDTRAGRVTPLQGAAAVAVAGAIAAMAMASGALAATGDLTYRGCISGNTAQTGCALTSGATADGEKSGLSGLDAVEVSPDGSSVYAHTDFHDQAIVRFSRNPAGGVLAFAECISATTDVMPCSLFPGAVAGGADTGLDFPQDIEISADGRSLYAVAESDTAVVRFNRDPASGALSFDSCISGETQTAGKCSQIPLATSEGNNSGFDAPQALALSPDGLTLYAASGGDQSVAIFDRASSGAISYRGCLSADASLTSCAHLPVATPDGLDSGFGSLSGLVVSQEGRSLYTVSESDDAIAHFVRDPGTGALTFVRCLTADGAIPGCDKTPGAFGGATGTGLDSLESVATSPDGNSVYAAADNSSSVIHYRRDPATGAISFESCLSGEVTTQCASVPGPAGPNNGMRGATSAAVAPDARSVDVIAGGDAGLTHFVRDPRTGALTHAGCLSAETQSAVCAQLPGASASGGNIGLVDPAAGTVSSDGRSLYIVSGADAITRFDREPDAAGPVIELTGKKKQRPASAARAKGAKVKLTATCVDELCTELVVGAKLNAKLDGKRKRAGFKPVALGELQPGESAPLKLKPKKKAKRLLKQAGKAKVVVTATGTDLLGNEAEKRKRVKLKR